MIERTFYPRFGIANLLDSTVLTHATGAAVTSGETTKPVS
jgi:hypothetical protein